MLFLLLNGERSERTPSDAFGASVMPLQQLCLRTATFSTFMPCWSTAYQRSRPSYSKQQHYSNVVQRVEARAMTWDSVVSSSDLVMLPSMRPRMRFTAVGASPVGNRVSGIVHPVINFKNVDKVPEKIRFGNQFVDDFIFEDHQAADIPINALRVIFNIDSDYRNEMSNQKSVQNIYQVHWPQRPTNCFGKLGYSWNEKRAGRHPARNAGSPG